MKPTMIIFEGVDKSGKSTLLHEFNVNTNFKYWVLDRSFISSLVYNDMFGRNDEKYYLNVMESMKNSFNIIVCYITADVELIQERLIKHNELLPSHLKDINRVNELYIHYLNLSEIRYIKINTTNDTIEESLNKIINEFEKLEFFKNKK